MIHFFGPDSKSQVTMNYKNGVPQNITSIVVSTQHHESAGNNEIRKKVIEIIEGALPNTDLPKDGNIQ